jgi:hypothetical protein
MGTQQKSVMVGRGLQDRGPDPDRISDNLSEPVANPTSSVVGPCHLRLWSGRGRPWGPHPEAPA